MASPPSGAYSAGSSSLQNSPSGSERKRKRMLSNRESARRSRMRRQQHLDSLITQADQLKKENNQISTSIGTTTQLYLNIESENAILRAQMAELSNRLQSLNDIIDYINSSSSCHLLFDDEAQETQFNDCGFMDPWNSLAVNQPMMASADMLMY